MDHLVIVSLKVRTSIVTLPHCTSGFSVSPSKAKSKCKISSSILSNFLSKTRDVLRATHQRWWKKCLKCTRRMHMTTIWSLWRHLIRCTLALRCVELRILLTRISWGLLMRTKHQLATTCVHANPTVPATNEHDNVTLLPWILPPRTTSGNDIAAARHSVQHNEAVGSIYTLTL